MVVGILHHSSRMCIDHNRNSKRLRTIKFSIQFSISTYTSHIPPYLFHFLSVQYIFDIYTNKMYSSLMYTCANFTSNKKKTLILLERTYVMPAYIYGKKGGPSVYLVVVVFLLINSETSMNKTSDGQAKIQRFNFR